MKRIYACCVILLSILGLAVWGGFAVRRFQRTTEASLTAIQKEIESENFTAAAATAHSCLQDFRSREHILSIFIRRDYLANLDMSLCAIRSYATAQDTEEASAETSRAASQLYAICHLFLRML